MSEVVKRSPLFVVGAWVWTVFAGICLLGCVKDGLWLAGALFVIAICFAAPPLRPWLTKHVAEKRATIAAWVWGLAAIVVLVISLPKPPETPAAAPQKQSESKPKSVVSPDTTETTAQQDKVISFIRYVVMQNISCEGGMDLTQRAIDKIAPGRARPIDAFEEAKRGIKACSEALAEFSRTDTLDGVPLSDLALAKYAVKSCASAARSRKSAMELAQRVLDGDDRLASASKYIELRDSAKPHEAACRMSLLGIAERSKIPDSVVDFVRP